MNKLEKDRAQEQQKSICVVLTVTGQRNRGVPFFFFSPSPLHFRCVCVLLIEAHLLGSSWWW